MSKEDTMKTTFYIPESTSLEPYTNDERRSFASVLIEVARAFERKNDNNACSGICLAVCLVTGWQHHIAAERPKRKDVDQISSYWWPTRITVAWTHSHDFRRARWCRKQAKALLANCTDTVPQTNNPQVTQTP